MINNWRDLERHELNVYPDMQEWEREDLKKSIEKKFDNRFPIIIWQGPNDDEPGIIDGMQRYSVCKELDITPIVKQEYGEVDEIVDYIIRTNERRALEAGQKAIAILKMEEVVGTIKAAAKERKLSGDGTDHGPHAAHGRTDTLLAARAGVGKTAIKQARKVMSYSPDLATKVEQGKISLNAAFSQVQEKLHDQEADPSVFLWRRANAIWKEIAQVALTDRKDEISKEIFNMLKEGQDTSALEITLTLKK